ncbi:MAG: CopG family transcriptional regulator [Acidimicrobiales bacterium]
MRTTLNLDDDVSAALNDLARARGSSVSRAANDALRTGLLASQEHPVLEPYEPTVFDSGRALIDVTDVSEVLAVLDELDTRA